MLKAFTVADWMDLNIKATLWGRENGYKSWDSDRSEPVGEVWVRFYLDRGQGYFGC